MVDYSKCDGGAECVTSCPGSVFEVSQEWCKPVDCVVKNGFALKVFQKRVVQGKRPVSLAIRYHVPECFLCWQCVGACHREAIDVEYDDLDIRQYVLPTGDSANTSGLKGSG